MKKIRVLIAESPPALSEYLLILENVTNEIDIVTTSTNLVSVYNNCQPDLVIIVGQTHIPLLIRFRQDIPQAKVLFLVENTYLETGQFVLQLGVIGYLLYSAFLENPITVIRTTVAGKIVFDKELIDQLFS